MEYREIKRKNGSTYFQRIPMDALDKPLSPMEEIILELACRVEELEEQVVSKQLVDDIDKLDISFPNTYTDYTSTGYTSTGCCSKCGAPYFTPTIWRGILPPTPQPTCQCWNVGEVTITGTTTKD